MISGSNQGGFTIVETMIVLAVTGLLVVSALQLISGKQSETEFQVAINSLQQQLQKVTNETANNYYNDINNFSCENINTSYPYIQSGLIGSGSGQGTNISCILLGKAIRFGWASPNNSSSSNSYSIYTLAGFRLGQNALPVTTIQQASPVAIAPGNTYNTLAPDDSTTVNLANGLSFYGQVSLNGVSDFVDGTKQPVIIGFISTLGNITNGALESGSLQYQLYQYGNATGAWTSANKSTDYVDLIDGITPNLISNIGLCFNSGTTNQSGLISIGSNTNNGSGLSVSVDIYSQKDCS